MIPEPFTITVGCVGAIGNIINLSTKVAAFVGGVRDARKDMEAVDRELSSLKLCLQTLNQDATRITFPDTVREIVRSADMVVVQMTTLLDKLSSAHLGRKIQWTAVSRDEMNKFRSSLESHKTAIDVALDMASLQLISDVKHDTSEIRADTVTIKQDTVTIRQDTAQIASLMREIQFLRLQVSSMQDRGDTGGLLLQRFLDQSTSYADSVMDANEERESLVEVNTSSSDSEDSMPAPVEISLGTKKGRRGVQQADSPDIAVMSSQKEAAGEADGLKEAIGVPVRAQPIKTSRGELPANPVIATPASLLPPGSPNYAASSPTDNGFPKTSPSMVNNIDPSQQDFRGVDASATSAEVNCVLALHVGRAQMSPIEPVASPRQSHAEAGARSDVVEMNRRPDYAAIQSAELNRSALSPRKQKALDEILLSQIDGQRRTGSFGGSGPQSSYISIKETLDKGAHAGLHGSLLIELELRCRARAEVVDLLLSRGAGASEWELECALKVPDVYNVPTVLGIVTIMLEYGAKPNAATLHLAVRRGAQEVVAQLLRYGAPTTSDGVYAPPLHWAISQRNVGMVKLLLKHQASTTEIWGKQAARNALMRACNVPGSSTAVVKALLEHGADVNARVNLEPALVASCRRGDLETVRLLVDHGAHLDIRSRLHGNALKAATARGYAEVVSFLLGKGAQIEAQGATVGTALYVACKTSNFSVVQVLLSQGANVHGAGDDEYKSPLAAARARNHAYPNWESERILKLLEQRGARDQMSAASGIS